MAYDYSKLRGKIVEKYSTISAFSKDLGLTSESVSMKLNNKREFSQREIDKACELLGIKNSEMKSYFFTKKV